MTTRYVNTASESPGGDGTTNATTGDNRAYQSLNEAEAGLPATLTDSWRIVCEGSAADTTAVTFAGTTTSAANYIEIWTDPDATYGRHDGKLNTSTYRLTGSSYWSSLRFSVDYVRCDGLQIGSSSSTSDSGAVFVETVWGGIRVSRCVIYKAGGSVGIGIKEYTAYYGGNRYFLNVIYDFPNAGIVLAGTVAGYVSYAYNNTIHNCGIGITETGDGEKIAVNNLLRSCTTAASGTFAAGTDYNATDNVSMGYTVTGGGNTHDRLSQTSFAFTDEAGDDFHLSATDASARDYGVSDPGSGLFSDDIDGQSRTGLTWDIGADEYIAAGWKSPLIGSRLIEGVLVGGRLIR